MLNIIIQAKFSILKFLSLTFEIQGNEKMRILNINYLSAVSMRYIGVSKRNRALKHTTQNIRPHGITSST